MNLLKERLESAGIDVASARLASLAFDALRESDGQLSIAADILWRKLKAEPAVVKAMWLMPYLLDRQRDMRGGTPAVKTEKYRQTIREALAPLPPRAKLSPQSRATVKKLMKKAVEVIQFKYKMNDGRDAARVRAYEIDHLARDGALFAAIKSRLGVLPNSQSEKELGELMSPKEFNDIRSLLSS